MERSLSLLTDRIEVLRAAVRRARAQHPFQNIPAAEGATLFRPTVMKMCRYLCPGGEGSVVLPAGAGRFMGRWLRGRAGERRRQGAGHDPLFGKISQRLEVEDRDLAALHANQAEILQSR